MAEKCLICNKDIETGRTLIGKKGLEGLFKASIARKDGQQNAFKDKFYAVAHDYCRADYIKPQSISKYVSKNSLFSQSQPSPPETRQFLRSDTQSYSFKTKCFFCCHTIDDQFREQQKKKPLGSRQIVYQVRGDCMKEIVMECGTKRGDKWGEEVLRRVNIVGDLSAADAVYHDKCYKAFFTTKPTSKKRGRPEDEYVSKAMEEIYEFLDKKDDCQYCLEDLMNLITGEKPSHKTVKTKLFNQYGDRIVITQLHSKRHVICFRELGDKILTHSWYESRCDNEGDEALRLIRTAAALIKKDIQSQIYETEQYPASDSFLEDAEKMVPETLSVFLETLFSSKTRNIKKSKTKSIAISHAIIHGIRPRSFISPVLHGLAFLIHRKYAAKNLINLLANFGFSASYNDAQIMELSAIHHKVQSKPSGIFSQYVFDNADYNVATLDGLKTFHSMGGIECLAPARNLLPTQPIQKLLTVPSAKDVGTLGVLELETYENMGNSGLKSIKVEDLYISYPIQDVPFSKVSDILWIAGKWLGIEGIPEWKGYMRGLYEGDSPERSAIVPLPFINAPPTDYNTIYTALIYAARQAQQQGMKTCFVTFDQPLYIKSREIVASCRNDPLMSSIVVRLGGFHLLMSFLGCIGHIMAGSGLKEVLTIIFAANSVDKILTGHAFSRAVRGHVLVQTVLAQIILTSINISDEDKKMITGMLSELKEEKLILDEMNHNVELIHLQKKFHDELNSLKSNGPTAALWVQYFHMVSIMKQFIEAERSGDWECHLCSVQQMIPFFHASGHLQYSKCAHLYLQDMRSLPSAHPSHFHEFSQKRYFTIARSDSPGSGNWSDMTIEQVLMRGMKTHGGLTSGRGITDSVLAKWIGGASISIAICSALEDFARVQFSSGEQHIDYRPSRQSRNSDDRKKLFDWFIQHPPFPQLLSLVSLATGVVGNSNVNCHLALEVGKAVMAKIVGQNFSEMKQARKDKVISLASMGSTVTINNIIEVVDPLIIFQRIAIFKKTEADVQNLLEYELAPYPLALFNECGMRKTKKSALYDVFPVDEEAADFKITANVIDGGFLLHRVKWVPGSTFNVLLNQYLKYIETHYGNQCIVVFDGYLDINSTKRAEQKRRGSTKTSVDITFKVEMTLNVQQEHFLANENNKVNFIKILSQKLNEANIQCITAKGDADTTIVRCALEIASTEDKVAIIGEDIDLLVLLIALAPPERNILFIKPGRGKVESRLYSSAKLQKLEFAKSIMFIHAFSGCDTTSSIYRKGKGKIVKLFKKNRSLSKIADIFYKTSSTPEAVTRAGEQMFLEIYTAQQNNLNEHRYIEFLRSSNKVKPDLASLPPTRGSAQQHAYRVYYQIQLWLANQIRPEAWGWQRGVDGALEPVKTNDPAAPQYIMHSIFCKCTAGCGQRCGCRKAGITCTSVCSNCEGSCTNRPPQDEDYED